MKLFSDSSNTNFVMVLLCVVCLILSSIIVVLSLEVGESKYKYKPDENNGEISETLINRLISNVPNTGEETYFEPFSPYRETKVDKKNVSVNLMYAMAAQKVEKTLPTSPEKIECDGKLGACEVFYRKNDIENKIYEMYGTDLKLATLNNFTGFAYLECNLENEIYGCINKGEDTVSFLGNIGTNHHRYSDYEINGNFLYIYEDYFNLKYSNKDNEDLITFQIYSSSDEKVLLQDKKYFVKDFISHGNYENEIFEILGSKVAKYKHIFKKTDNGYVWISTEPVK